MRTVKVKQVLFGEGRPKICVPMTGKTREVLLQEAQRIVNSEADLAEWRIDWFDRVFQREELISCANEIRSILGDRPLIMTFRSKEEGGEKEISIREYEQLLIGICENQAADIIDIELFKGDSTVEKIVHIAKKNGVITIGSNHDFHKTPPKDEIIKRLCNMQELDLHMTKIAVMPQCDRDVLTLLDATLAMKETYGDRPFITMSMAKTGLISRLVGEQFGSCLTFGTAGAASAPGQIDAKELSNILEVLSWKA